MSQFKMFEKGAVSFSLFYINDMADLSIVNNLAGCVAPHLSDLKLDPITGFVEGHKVLGRDITDMSCVFGKYVYAATMKAEKKIPTTLLDIERSKEEEAEKVARGVDFISRDVKSDIKKRVVDRLKPDMPPSISGMPFVINTSTSMMLAAATSDSQIDDMATLFRMATCRTPVLVTPETYAFKKHSVNERDLYPCCFSPDQILIIPSHVTIGMDFLTWLWFEWETNGGVFENSNGQSFSYMLEGPLSFFREGQGAHKAVLSKGNPTESREAFQALLCGKKLTKAKITIAHDEKIFTVGVDSEFCFKSMKLPKVGSETGVSDLVERMTLLELFLDDWFSLFDRFVDLRSSEMKWSGVLIEMEQWISKMVNK